MLEIYSQKCPVSDDFRGNLIQNQETLFHF